MRLLFWTQLYWPHIGGVEVFTGKLIAAMRARGHEAAVVTSHSDLDLPDEETHEDVPVHRLPFHSALAERDPAVFLAARRRVAKLKESSAPDVVHINFSDPSVMQAGSISRSRQMFVSHAMDGAHFRPRAPGYDCRQSGDAEARGHSPCPLGAALSP